MTQIDHKQFSWQLTADGMIRPVNPYMPLKEGDNIEQFEKFKDFQKNHQKSYPYLGPPTTDIIKGCDIEAVWQENKAYGEGRPDWCDLRTDKVESISVLKSEGRQLRIAYRPIAKEQPTLATTEVSSDQLPDAKETVDTAIEDLIDSIHINDSNFKHIASTGKINGTLRLELRRILNKQSQSTAAIVQKVLEVFADMLTQNPFYNGPDRSELLKFKEPIVKLINEGKI